MPIVLIADDNPLSLRFFADALERIGVQVRLVDDGGEAEAIAARETFDLLLLDARMPVLEGAEVLARIRTGQGPNRAAPALATTADADPSAHARLSAAGFAGVITKPVRVEALHAAIAPYFRIEPQTGTAATGFDANFAPLDDAAALSAAGGDRAIVRALRGLLCSELGALPAEIAEIAERRDLVALRDRLHRLDASAGFCGAPELVRAGAELRAAADDGSEWPIAAAERFLAVCASMRDLLGRGSGAKSR